MQPAGPSATILEGGSDNHNHDYIRLQLRWSIKRKRRVVFHCKVLPYPALSASHRASGGVHRGVCRPADRLCVRLGRSCASTSIRHCLTYVCLCLLHALSCSLALAHVSWTRLISPRYVIGTIMVVFKDARLGMTEVGSDVSCNVSGVASRTLLRSSNSASHYMFLLLVR